jgi:hypothetical protein
VVLQAHLGLVPRALEAGFHAVYSILCSSWTAMRHPVLTLLVWSLVLGFDVNQYYWFGRSCAA